MNQFDQPMLAAPDVLLRMVNIGKLFNLSHQRASLKPQVK